MSKLEKNKLKLEKLKKLHKAMRKNFGYGVSASDMSSKEKKLEKKIKKLEKKEDNVVWNMYAESCGIKSGKAYKHIFINHTHPLGDKGEDMVTFDVALKAIKKAEKEIEKKYEDRKN